MNIKSLNKWKANAVRIINSLGEETVEISNSWKYPIRENWIDNLINFYKKHPGKFEIHLNDLPDKVCVKLNLDGKEVLKDLHQQLIKKIGSKSIVKKLTKRTLAPYFKDFVNFISLRTLRRNFALLDIDINILEKYLIEIKPGKSGATKSVKNPNFPINFLNKDGGVLIGSFPDACVIDFTFSSKHDTYLTLLEDSANNLIGDIKSTRLNYPAISKLHLTPLIRDILSVAGIVCKRQIKSNNAVPLYSFIAPPVFLKNLLRTIWDAEGSNDYKRINMGQSVAINIDSIIAKYPFRTRFSQLSKLDRKVVLKTPPFLLLSMHLIMYKLGIQSRLAPKCVYRKKNGTSVCDWTLRITGHSNLTKFYENIGFNLEYKQKKLENTLDYARAPPKPKNFREVELLEAIKEFEHVSVKQLAEKVGLSPITVQGYLKRLFDKNLVSRTRQPLPKRSYRFVYKVIK